MKTLKSVKYIFLLAVITTMNAQKKAHLDKGKPIEERISLNPVLHSFQLVVHKYNIEWELIDSFLKSMEMDLKEQTYCNDKYDEYILGSAQVVGLMCLRVFTNGNDEEYLKLKHLIEQYNNLSNWSLAFYVLAFILNGLAFTNNIILILIGLINLVLMYVFIYKSIQNLEEIEEITGRRNFTNIYIAILFGFPFLLFIYFFNKTELKEALKEYNS